MVRRSFLSVDTVGSTQIKRDNSALAVEYTFGQYQKWIEEIVRAEGGEMQSAAGDGVMAVFTTDSASVRAGQRLLSDLPRFNQQQNQCSAPIAVRIGVNAGPVALEPGASIGSVQSPVVDRAAALQKRAEPDTLLVDAQISPDALAMLSPVAPAAVSEPGQETNYRWRVGDRFDL